MSDIKWIKITTDIFDDEKILLIESLPDADAIIVIWFKLLCLAGKQNNSGVFLMNDRIPYTDKMLATIFRRKESTVQLALQTFENFGMVELVDGVITIPNWEKHQNIDGMEKIREQNRLRVAKHREKQKNLLECNVTENVTVTERNAIDKDKEKDKEEDKEKEKDKKKSGSAAYEKILSEFVLEDEVKEAIREFIKMRKLIKAPMTEKALCLMTNKLRQMSLDPKTQVAILNQSIENSWKGIFPLRETNKNRTAQQLNESYDMMAAWAESEE